MPSKARGLYPGQGNGLGVYGSTAYPTVIEAYNRASDYKRWRLGMEYWFGNGKAWADRELMFVARLRHGPVHHEHHLVTTLFPSRVNDERSRYVTCRVRGSVILESPLDITAIVVDQVDTDPSQHRLVYDTRGVLTPGQLQAWGALIGDQFEDSATGPNYPDDLMRQPLDAVALTLVEVDVTGGRLIFDLSRPYARKSVAGRTYWYAPPYDPDRPLLWRLDGSRHLCSSSRFQCSCPDYQGRMVAFLQDGSASTGDLFPLPSASRTGMTPWEAQAAGYYRQWRTLDVRADRRRECKHIHAARWRQNVPFLEPRDYPVGGELPWADELSYYEREYAYSDVAAFYARQLVGYDRLVPAIAGAIGLSLDPTGDLRGDRPGYRPDENPILWTDAIEPKYAWARQNDWWLKRGTDQVYAFSPADGGFSDRIGGMPVLQIVERESADAAVVVP